MTSGRLALLPGQTRALTFPIDILELLGRENDLPRSSLPSSRRSHDLVVFRHMFLWPSPLHALLPQLCRVVWLVGVVVGFVVRGRSLSGDEGDGDEEGGCFEELCGV